MTVHPALWRHASPTANGAGVTTALALLSGALLVAGFPKFGHPAFAWIALSPLIVAVALSSGDTTRAALRSFRLGFLSGIVYFVGTLYWVVGVMQMYGGLPTVVAGLVALLLAAYLAIYPALFALLVGVAVRRMGIAGVWLAPAVWVSTEWLRSTIAGGFPWVLLGASQATVLPIVQLASLVGVYGLSVLVALVSAAAAAVALSRASVHRWGATVVAVFLVLVAIGGSRRVAAGDWVAGGEALRVGLVQGSVARRTEVRREASGRDPPALHRSEPAGDRRGRAPRDLARGVDAVLLRPRRGTWRRRSAGWRPRQRRHSSSAPTSSSRRRGRQSGSRTTTPRCSSAPTADRAPSYRKMQLVPFGEYVPFKRLLFFVGPLIEAVSDFSAGTEPTVFDADGRRVSVAICYESVYPWIAREFVARGSQLLVDDHERRVVQAIVGGLSAFRSGHPSRGRRRPLRRACGEHRHQRRRRPVRPCARCAPSSSSRPSSRLMSAS